MATGDQSLDGSIDGVKRRRILQVAGGTAAGSAFIGTASADHECAHPIDSCPDDFTPNCNADGEEDAFINFECQEVHEEAECEQSVFVECAYLPNGGYIDIHDKTENCDDQGRCFSAGYPLGATTYLDPGYYECVEVPLFEEHPGDDTFGDCIDLNQCELEECKEVGAMLHVDTGDDEEFTHYCSHDGPGEPDDPAYLCDLDDDGEGEPIEDTAEICPPGAGGGCTGCGPGDETQDLC